MQAILEVELASPADHMREQVAIEGGVGRQDRVQIEHVLRGDQLVEPDGARWYLSPLTPGPRVIRVGPAVPDLLENHEMSLDEPAASRPVLRFASEPAVAGLNCSAVSISLPAEDSPSGLGRTLGKRVGGNPSRVRISHPPPG